ncbi:MULTISPECIES: Pls/PosA family non-ribosomal peptide synthetase [unclassified Streptomyces]|uniref:Pls/PosA family non-ribosomal peptide synthetase n=1 Tax=unclassified Streptomyces TaxID=2593676 RepID=UPI002DDC2A75|nr:Pls/PosA family non-ribosomal peptide synthetase [Streptomyces sp. NBC_01750]WSB04462.1 phosphopantetheine-binding protein [Streptomyces sp. NBC_01794]WSD31255.1 phosphopantetheine-binding protein [Streptomyces sp. NBC_01750]
MKGKSVEVLTPGPDESAIPSRGYTGPKTGIEENLAELLADLMCVEQVSVDSHFFDDLGANSLVMAHFCARVRKREDLPSASMKDIYRHPTIQSLATALADAAPAPVESSVPASPEVVTQAGTLQYVLCGTLQALMFLGYCFLAGLVTVRGYEWVAAGSDLTDIYLRSALFGGAGFIGLCTFPIAAKWILIGRWKPREFPVWSLTYLRFWTVKSLIHANPMILFVGNPLYVLYLRALGARIGKGVTILSPTVPVCTDLLTIGAGTVIRKDSFFLCYRAHAGRIQTGRITLGRDVFIGEKTVLDIDTSMGDGAQLGHTSALQSGQVVPDGQRWHGSPAQRTELDYVRVAPADCGTLRRAGFGLITVLQLFLLYVPLTIGGAYMLVTQVPTLSKVLDPGTLRITSPKLYIDALFLSLLVFFGFVVMGLAILFAVPRLLNLVIKPDKVYPLYGLHYSTHRAIARMTNIKFFKWLFGDSSYIVHYLRGLGYDLSHVEQTGSNFGTEVQHETPYLTSVGSGTMIADGLSIVNADFSSTSFRVSRASIGPHNFLGNNIAYPSGARTGENCLLATKVMIPLDGEIREGVGLLGSPCFEIPRSVERDTRFDHLRTGDERHRNLAAKNRYNIRTMGFFLFVRWLHFFVLTVLGLAAIDLYGVFGQVMIAMSLALTLVFTAVYFVIVERGIAAFRALKPQLCSIYEPYFWWHERLWKVPDEYLNVFNGTPFKNVIWRMLGVRIGNRVFDDGCYLTERTLTTIGNDCTLNAGSKIQCHSQEDGTFKSDFSTIGDGCTLGVGAHVHYGVTMGDRAVLAPDSFLMKGEEMPPHARWGGNPATETRDAHYQPAAVVRKGQQDQLGQRPQEHCGAGE